MAITRHSGNRLISTDDNDSKPTLSTHEKGTTWFESYTDDLYMWDGDSWNIVAGNTIAQTLTTKTFDDHITVKEISAPSTPASGYGAIYVKNDNKLYFKNDAGAEFDVTAGSAGGEANQNAVGTFAITGTSSQANVVSDSEADTVTLHAGTNMTITSNASSDTITFAASGGEVTVQDEGSSLSTAATTLNFVGSGVTAAGTGATKTITIPGGGGSQNLFQTIAVSGQDNVVADSTTDTLTLVASGGMTITTNASNDTVTFSASGGSTITVTDNEAVNENNLITFVADAGTATGAHGLEMDGDFHYNPSTGRLTATQLAGTLQTAAQTNITSVGALNGGSITSGFGSIDVGSSAITTTGTITAGNLNVTGTTTTINSTNTTISDRRIELQSGAGSSSGDAGIIIERGSTGDNAIMAWDESADRFIFGTTTATGATTDNNLSITVGTINANIVGTITGDITGNVTGTADIATEITAVANNSANETVYPTFVDGATGTQGLETDTGLTYNPSTGLLTTATISTTQVDITAQGDIRLQDTTGGQYVGFQAPGTVSSSVLWTLPAADGSNTQVLQTDGNGTLSWVNNAGGGGGGNPGGSNYQVQYNNSSSFGGASNVEIRSNTLALKEQSSPSAVSGYGQIYPKTDNNLYYLNDSGNEHQITGLNPEGQFYGVKAYLNADLNISNNSATALGDSAGSWTEIYDIGTWHDASTNPDRFTFPTIGYYLVAITQRWATDSAGYREIKVRHTASGSTSDILVDRISNVGFTTPYSTASTVVYIANTADYLTVTAYQNSGGTLALEGGTKEDTGINISRLDAPSNISSASMVKARLSTATTAVAHDTETAIGYNAEVFDTQSYHDNSTNNHRFVIPNTGYYLIKAKATLAGTSGDANYEVRLRIKDGNGVELAEEYTTHGTVASTYVTVSTSSIAYLSASDWVAAYVTHQRDAATNLIGGDQELTSFEVLRLDGATTNNVGNLLDTNITSIADASLLIYDTGTSTWRNGVISGDATMSDTGAVTIAANAVEGTMLNANVVDDSSLQLASNTLNIKAAGVTGTMLNANVVDDSSLQLASNTLNVKALGITNAMLAGSIAVAKTELVAGTGITLSTNTLNVDAAQTQITSVGALDAGSITSGFTSIDVGAGAITTTGTITAGNLVVSGTTTTVNTATLSVEDPLIFLANGNGSGDTVDIGFYGLYDTSGSQDLYAGLFRDRTDDKFKLFKGLQATPGTEVNVSGTGYTVATLVAALEGNATTATTLATARDIGGVSFNGSASINLPGVNAAGNQNTSGTAAGLSATLISTSGGTGQSSYTQGDILYYASGTTLTKLAKGTAGQALKMNSGSTAPGWADAATGSSDKTQVEVAQSSHPFQVGDVVRLSGDDTYAKARANTVGNAEVIGIVTVRTDGNNFTMVTNGHITTAAAVPNNAAGTVLFLDPDNDGELITTEPTTDGQISKPVAIITNANDSMLFLNLRGKVVGAEAITTEKLQSSVTQITHGFVVGDVIRSSGTNAQYQKAVASNAENAEAIGIVVVSDWNGSSGANATFTAAWGGIVDTAAAVPNVAAGTVLFLSASSTGALTATEPSAAGQVSKPFAVVTNQSTEMILTHFRGEVISSASVTAPVDAQYVVLSANSTLTVERVLTGGSGITLTDGGAGSTITVANDLVTAGGNIGGHLLPAAQNTHDLGSTNYQWRNIYTQDFHLNNTLREEGNSVDGTRGDWTIQEGEEDLFILNNKTGKKYKFNLTEVS